MPVAVSDASVLICLGAVGQFQLLRDFYGEVVVPEAVWLEVTNVAASRPGVIEVVQAHQAGWLIVNRPHNRGLVRQLRSGLGAGEAEAIALASQISTLLLV